MHGDRFPLQELLYGASETAFSMRLDFDAGAELGGFELRLKTPDKDIVIPHVSGRVIEASVPFSELAVEPGAELQFQLSIWQKGLPMASLPHEGWLSFSTAEPL